MSSLEAILERGYAEAPIRVRYAETDQMGVVYHANYLIWFEVGRVEFIRQAGFEYKDMEREGAAIAVVEARVRFRSPARYDDELVVRTRLAGMRGPIVRFTYQLVRRSDGALLAVGETEHVVVGRDMKMRELPPQYAERFRMLLRKEAEDTP